MELSDEVLETTARLAALDLSPSERATLRSELEAILTYVKRLDQVPSTASGRDSEGDIGLAGLRADEPREGLSRVDALRQATDSDGETFSVPPVLDNP